MKTYSNYKNFSLLGCQGGGGATAIPNGGGTHNRVGGRNFITSTAAAVGVRGGPGAEKGKHNLKNKNLEAL